MSEEKSGSSGREASQEPPEGSADKYTTPGRGPVGVCKGNRKFGFSERKVHHSRKAGLIQNNGSP